MRTRTQFSRCYTSYENNKRPSEDFHSKLIIDNMYVEVTLQTEYNIRKNSRNFLYNSNLPGLGAHKSHDVKSNYFIDVEWIFTFHHDQMTKIQEIIHTLDHPQTNFQL